MIHVNWTGLAESILAVYAIYGVAGYLMARREGKGQFASLAQVVLGFIVLFLVLGGAAMTLAGLGVVVISPAQFEGSGAVEPGEWDWQSPRLALILLGLSMVAGGWFFGKGVERLEESVNDRIRRGKAALESQNEKPEVIEPTTPALKGQFVKPEPPKDRIAEKTSGTFDGRLIVGVPICRVPEHVRQYPNFLTWWKEVGRLNPEDHNGWSSISGPGVMRGRSEIIDPLAWQALPLEEQEMIREWAEGIPLGVLYD